MPTAPTMGVSDGLDGRSQAWSRSASALLLGALREAALPPDREQSVRQWLQSDASAAWHYMTGAAGEAARQAAAADGARPRPPMAPGSGAARPQGPRTLGLYTT